MNTNELKIATKHKENAQCPTTHPSQPIWILDRFLLHTDAIAFAVTSAAMRETPFAHAMDPA